VRTCESALYPVQAEGRAHGISGSGGLGQLNQLQVRSDLLHCSALYISHSTAQYSGGRLTTHTPDTALAVRKVANPSGAHPCSASRPFAQPYEGSCTEDPCRSAPLRGATGGTDHCRPQECCIDSSPETQDSVRLHDRSQSIQRAFVIMLGTDGESWRVRLYTCLH